MRIAVIGTSGSGKTTLARHLAAEFAVAHIELDAINWQPGWRDLNRTDPEEFRRRVDGATAAPAWVAEGSYSKLRPLVWGRATHLVWLDYERHVVMRRVILRSLWRAIDRRELWPGTGNRERLAAWISPSHPIRWAWSTWRRRRHETDEALAGPTYAHLKVIHLRQPREAGSVVGRLRQFGDQTTTTLAPTLTRL